MAPQPSTDTAAVKEGKLVRREEWRNIGFQTPSATVQTMEWAKINGDTNVIANGLAWADEKSRAEVEAMFAAAPESVSILCVRKIDVRASDGLDTAMPAKTNSGSGKPRSDEQTSLELPPGVRLLRTLEGHTDMVRSVPFDPGGRILASGSDDHTVKLWDPSNDELLHSLEAHTKSVDGIAFSFGPELPMGGVRVIPVLLPGAGKESVPMFARHLDRVDLRDTEGVKHREQLRKLVKAILNAASDR